MEGCNFFQLWGHILTSNLNYPHLSQGWEGGGKGWYKTKPGGLDSRDQSRSRFLDLLRQTFKTCRDFMDCRDEFFFVSIKIFKIKTFQSRLCLVKIFSTVDTNCLTMSRLRVSIETNWYPQAYIKRDEGLNFVILWEFKCFWEKSNIIFNQKELHECHLNATLLKIIMNYFTRYYLKLCYLAILYWFF